MYNCNHIISINVGKTIINHPQSSPFLWVVCLPFPIMGGKNGIGLPTLTSINTSINRYFHILLTTLMIILNH